MTNTMSRRLAQWRDRTGKQLGQFPVERTWIFWFPLMLALLAYAGMFLHRSIVALEQGLPAVRAESARVGAQAAEVRQLQLGGTKRSLDPMAAKQALLVSLQKAQLDKDVVTMATGVPGEISIDFAATKFDNWVQWVETLFNETGIALQSCQVAQVSSGIAKVNAKLSY